MNNRKSIILTFSTVLVAACGPPSPPPPGGDMGVPGDMVTNLITVKSGEKIQTAVDNAQDGYTVEVEPGTYNEAIDIPATRAIKNFTLRCKKGTGGERVILDGMNQLQNGVFVAEAAGFTIEGCQVQNYNENGVWVGKSSDVVFRDVVVIHAGKYGVFPQECNNVLIEKCTASQLADAALYVGQSTGTIIVQDNEVFANVTGIECENSLDCQVRRNNSHDNTQGILVFTLPHLPRKDNLRAQIYENTITKNNLANFANPSDIVANVPSGGGMLIMGADDVNVHNNTIDGHDKYAIGLISLKLLFPNDPLDVDPDPSNVQIHDNTFTKNGTDGNFMWSFMGMIQLPGADIAYDGSGMNDCAKNNTTDMTSKDFALVPLMNCP